MYFQKGQLYIIAVLVPARIGNFKSFCRNIALKKTMYTGCCRAFNFKVSFCCVTEEQTDSFYGRNLNVQSAHEVCEGWASWKNLREEFYISRMHLLTTFADEARSGHFCSGIKMAADRFTFSVNQIYFLPKDSPSTTSGLSSLLTQRADCQLRHCQSHFLPCLDFFGNFSSG